MSAEDIQFFLHLHDQIKVYHWQTRVYARHMATDKVLATLDKSIDSYVEVYIGKMGRPKITAKTGAIHVQNMSEAGASRMIKAAIRHMSSKKYEDIDSDLGSIRDDIVADLNQLLYLFTLH
jgi:hypothetical protein